MNLAHDPILNKMTIFSVGWFFFLFSSVGLASDFHSPRTDALGGAGHASPLLNDAIYSNPSFTPFVRTHSLSFNYLSFAGGVINTSDYYGHNINASVVDGTAETLFQAGVGYTRRDDASIIHVTAAKGLIERMGIGLGGKFIFPNNTSGNHSSDASLSTTGIVASWFQTAVIVDNLFESAASLGFYREYTLGTKINLQGIASLFIDPHWIPSLPLSQSTHQATWGFEAGAEFTFMSDFFLRIGTFQNSTVPFQAQKGDGFGAGIGWLGPKLSFDYGYSRVNLPIASYSHNFGATLFF